MKTKEDCTGHGQSTLQVFQTPIKLKVVQSVKYQFFNPTGPEMLSEQEFLWIIFSGIILVTIFSWWPILKMPIYWCAIHRCTNRLVANSWTFGSRLSPGHWIRTGYHSSSVVECRTRNHVSPGSNLPLLPFRRLGIFVLSIDARLTQLYKWVPGYRQWWTCEWFSLCA